MKKVILMILLLGFVCINGYAQKVYKKDGKVYLECTVANGMPAGSVTTTPKCVEGSASAAAFRDGSTSGTNPYASENNQVFEKLEIAASNEAGTMLWLAAYNSCQAKNSGGVTGWRLPTQRELMLIYIFREKLESMTGSTFGRINYWSSSEDVYNTVWIVNFYYRSTNTLTKANSGSGNVRCVREVTP